MSVILDIIIYGFIDMFFGGKKGSSWSVKREGWTFIFMSNEDATIGGSTSGKQLDWLEKEDIEDRDLDAPITNDDFYDGPDW